MRAERYLLRQRWLPYAAAALLIVALVSGWVAASELSSYKSPRASDSGAAGVRDALDELEAATRAGSPLSPDLEAFKGLARRVPYAGTVLLVDANGQVLYRRMPRKAGYLSDLTTAHMQRVLAAVPADVLNAGQRLLLLTGDAVLAEGEHADIYNYAARLLVDGQGSPVGAVAVAYDRSALGPSSPYKAALLISLGALLLYWAALPLWVFLDARERGERAWLWAALAAVGNLLGVVTYLLMRRPLRLACPGCGAAVRAGDEACPQCGLRLRLACPACRGPLEAGWKFCPRCASRVAEEPSAG